MGFYKTLTCDSSLISDTTIIPTMIYGNIDKVGIDLIDNIGIKGSNIYLI